MMNKTERTELQRLVRGRMKVLRTEVDQRGAEMLAEVDEQIAARFSDQDRNWQNVMFLAEQAVLEANRKVNDVLRESGYTVRGDTEPILVYLDRHRMTQPPGDRHQLRQTAMTKIGAQMQAAKVRLAAQEQDLLQELALGVLESDEARGFLARIPTVGELVPGARLAALEQQLDDDGPPA